MPIARNQSTTNILFISKFFLYFMDIHWISIETPPVFFFWRKNTGRSYLSFFFLSLSLSGGILSSVRSSVRNQSERFPSSRLSLHCSYSLVSNTIHFPCSVLFYASILLFVVTYPKKKKNAAMTTAVSSMTSIFSLLSRNTTPVLRSFFSQLLH